MGGKRTGGAGGGGTNLSNDEKLALCEHAAQHPGMSQRALGVWAQRTFHLPSAPSQATVSNVLRKRDELSNMVPAELAVKRQRVLKHPELDRALANWALYTIQQSAQPLTGNAIKKKAVRFAELLYPGAGGAEGLAFSNGWLGAFKERHGIKGLTKKAHDRELAERSLPELQQLTAAFAPRDVYCFDEFGLYYDMPPDRDAAAAAAKRRNRLTLAVCVNADGSDAHEPLFVGRVRHPRSFGGRSALELGFRYESNVRAQTSELVWQRWLQQFNARMRDDGRHVLLLLDTAAAHVTTGISFDHVQVAFLPGTSGGAEQLQPLSAGVVAAFKRRYRRLQLMQALDRQELGERNVFAVDQRQAMEWSVQCWQSLPADLVQQCWQQTRLLLAAPATVAATGDELLQQAAAAGAPAPLSLSPLPAGPGRRKSREEQDIESDISKHLEWLGIANAMGVAELLSPEDENCVHAGVEDEDFVGCAIQRECESDTEQQALGDGEDPDEGDGRPPPAPEEPLSDEQKLAHISQVLRFLDEHPCENATGRDLRKNS
ncbi:hypothetical protein PybrP1_008113 [[Pythium] brassicae (nom. inval.)]|nr:hypothetical protein PybrP1_008113 [[Pythium] brassicae (nom. inval.)]